jgi:spermidine synthase
VYGEFKTPSPAGTYVTLRLTDDSGKSQVMMSDLYYERATCVEVVQRAHGDVLVAGLGIGMILHPILRKEAVRSVTVIEGYPDVVDLVLPTLPTSEKLTVVLDDIYTWKAPHCHFIAADAGIKLKQKRFVFCPQQLQI